MKTENYLFNVGEKVVYVHRGTSKPCIVTERRQEQDYFLSEAWGREVYFNVYLNKSTLFLKSSQKFVYYDDKEIFLRSADIIKPKKAHDYQSDEFTADWLDENGNILKTVKSGKIGFAHEIVSESLLKKERIKRILSVNS